MQNYLHPQLEATLLALRNERRFVCESYLEAKSTLLNNYCERTGLRACIVPVSGGIDSSVTLGIVRHAAAKTRSPIQRTIAVSIPSFNTEGTSNQEIATDRGKEVATTFGAEYLVLDIGSCQRQLRTCVEGSTNHIGSSWAAGQLVSYLRTPTYYYLATLLTDQGFRCTVVGTTNRDEGAYIGFFGKASDGMVDIQLISDLHKSEVRIIAERLGVPASVREAEPTGDVFDGRTHRQMIGAPYDAIELFQLLRSLRSEAERATIMHSWSEAARSEFARYEQAIEKLHAQNLHKYLGGSPSVHLDVYPRAVPGGWREEIDNQVGGRSQKRALVNEVELPAGLLSELTDNTGILPTAHALKVGKDPVQQIENLLSTEEAQSFREQLLASTSLGVGVDGRRSSAPLQPAEIGSFRATIYSESLAKILWERVRLFVDPVRICDRFTAADADGYPVWRAVGVNPALRLIRYSQGGSLVPHYDAAFDFGDGRRRTLMTLIIYLSEGDPSRGGSTRFLRDAQRALPTGERDFSDWKRLAAPHEVACSIQPTRGRALLFDHRLLHDVEPWQGLSDRLILRTDIVFERCGLQPVALPEVAPQDVFGHPESNAALYADPFYGSAAQVLQEAELREAGWIAIPQADLAHATAPAQQRLLTTPVHRIQQQLNTLDTSDRAPIVLLASGSFCPVHAGHLEMMELAKAALEAQGEVVIGGYLSPSHDTYVGRKCGSQTIDGAERVRLCQNALAGSSWLHVDPWEALYPRGELNFTTVILRLERYLNTHLRTAQPVQVVFVCGGDNAGFALAFVQHGRCVCVQRVGSEATFSRIAAHWAVRGNRRILMVRSTPSPLASRALRQKRLSAAQGSANISPLALTVRDEGAWAAGLWRKLIPQAELETALAQFRQGLVRAFQNVSEEIRVDLLALGTQEEACKARGRLLPTISLDPCIPGDYNLGISRSFSFGITERLAGLVARPGWPTIEHQLRALPAGEYILMDDDQATGYTTRTLLSLLPETCRVASIEHLWTTTARMQAAGYTLSVITDTVDLRDFLVGSRDGGLVIELPCGTKARAPYLAPYVQLSDRASIPAQSEIVLSRNIWQLNRAFFSTLSVLLAVQDASQAFQHLAHTVGFAPDTPLVEVCDWHLEQLPRGCTREPGDAQMAA